MALVLALLLALPAAAGAGVRRAESVLPPGQSGFIPPTGVATGSGSPHLTDQFDLFTGFAMKPATLRLPGTEERPRAGVRITRDGFGVPSVYGDTDPDAWFGAGYAIAQDRMFQLELFRRVTQGRAAAVLGREYLELDKAVRAAFYTSAELREQFARLPARFQERFRAYRDGINAWLSQARADPMRKLPGEFAAIGLPSPGNWTLEDSLAIGVYLARIVPTSRGHELANARALKAVGARAFDRVLPLITPGAVATVPASAGRFPSQPGRTRRQERAALRRSAAYVRGLTLPARDPDSFLVPGSPREQPQNVAASAATPEARRREALVERARAIAGDLFSGRLGLGGSYVWAMRGPGGTATLVNGPQLGFSIPSILVELEVHGPGLDARGFTAAGVPIVGIGFNDHVAWGFTSGTSDDDDLYVEQLSGSEGYRFRGERRAMDCRQESFEWRPPPSNLIPSTSNPRLPDLSAGSETVRMCRTVHGPLEARVGNTGYARRYAAWGRELETFGGIAALNEADTIEDVDRAVAQFTWNENVMAIDDRGNLGFWHPGLMPLRPRGWDERLPYPGTGEAEWRGYLPRSRRPHVLNPRQGWLANWNNLPSAAWTSGDAPDRPILNGRFDRGVILRAPVAAARAAGGGFDRTVAVDRATGTTAQGRLPATVRLRRARRGATGAARTVLDALVAWDGSYDRVTNGAVDPGVPAWDAFLDAARAEAIEPLGAAPLLAQLEDGRSAQHVFDTSFLQAYALRTLDAAGYRRAAARAFETLRERFGSGEAAAWRERRRRYIPGSTGAGSLDPFPFTDRGSAIYAIELGP